MRAATLLVLLTLLPVTSFSQSGSDTNKDNEYTDVVLLNSGGRVQGRIIENIEGKKKIKVERRDGMIIELPRKRIVCITTADLADELQKQIQDSLALVPERQKTSNRYSISAGMLSGSDLSFLSVSVIYGVNFGDRMMAGPALEANFASSRNLFGVLGHLRGYISSEGNTPFLFGEFGGQAGENRAGLISKTYGGILFGLGLGYMSLISPDYEATVELGYRTLLRVSSDDGYESPLHLLNLRFGLIF